MSSPKEALPVLPERYRHMFCTKCGYTNPQTSAPAGKQGALCENVHCGYMAFVTEREFTADQMHAFREAGLSELRAEVERLKGVAMWQPIETAPKSTAARLVFCPGRQNIYVVSWDARYGGEWLFFGGGGILFEEPTHWLPLPSPPKGSGG